MFAGFDGGPFIVRLLAAGNGYFDFDKAVFEVHGEGEEGESFLVGKGREFVEFSFVEEEFALSSFFVIEDAAKFIGGNGAVFKPCFVTPDDDVGVLKAAAVGA